MNWKLRVLLDSVKAILPFQSPLRSLKRRFSQYTPDKGNTRLAFNQGIIQLNMLLENNVSVHGKNVLEIGSGWAPVIPILFSVAGAKNVRMTDVEKLMDKNTFFFAVDVILENIDKIPDELSYSRDLISTRLRAIDRNKSFSELLNDFSLDYMILSESDKTTHHEIDIVLSRAVLEHISPTKLAGIFTEYRKIMNKDGAMCHIVDNSDHFEHKDKSISKINFLKYSEFAWSLTGLNIQNYQNRLRHDDYVALFRDCGFSITQDRGEIDADALAALETFSVDKRFAGRPPATLATITSYFLCKIDGAR